MSSNSIGKLIDSFIEGLSNGFVIVGLLIALSLLVIAIWKLKGAMP